MERSEIGDDHFSFGSPLGQQSIEPGSYSHRVRQSSTKALQFLLQAVQFTFNKLFVQSIAPFSCQIARMAEFELFWKDPPTPAPLYFTYY